MTKNIQNLGLIFLKATTKWSGNISGEASLQVSDALNFLGLLRREMDCQRLPG